MKLDLETRLAFPTRPSSPRLLALLAATLCGLAGCTGEGEGSPRPEEASSTIPQPTSQPDSARVVEDLAFLSRDEMGGRQAGSEGGSAARNHIVEAFRAAGVSNFRDAFEAPFSVPSAEGETTDAVNVVGFVRGTEYPDRFIVVSAHYDHLGTREGEVFNGADDNASGTAALMEFARLVAEEPLGHSILFTAFDAEEMGLRGARAFVESPPIPLENVVLNLNMDMISRNDSVLYVAGTRHYPELRAFVEPLVPDLPLTLRFGHDEPGTGSDDWTSASDHGPFHAAGIPFLYFGVEDHPDYHRSTDDFEKVNLGFYAASVRSIWRVLLEVDGALAPAAPASN